MSGPSQESRKVVTVPSRPNMSSGGKKPPIDDQERQRRQQERRQFWIDFVYDFGSIILGVATIAALILCVFWQDWNWWLLPIGVFAVLGIFWAFELTDDDSLAAFGAGLNTVCLIMMLFYGFYQIDTSGHEVSNKTALFCGLDSVKDDDGNVYLIFRSPDGDFVIADGTYYVTNPQTGKVQRIFLTTGKAASKTFRQDHTYKLTVDNFEGHDALDGIVSAREVPTTETCSDPS